VASSARVVSATNAAVAATLVAVLAGVALVVKPPAPPGIAEFAPQATKPITKAPSGQGSGAGAGSGACAVGQSCAPSPLPSPTAPGQAGSSSGRIGVPSALQCFSWPDGSVTQTEDPQSPPCVASWDGGGRGNGGATSQGVTASEIVIAADEYWSAGGKRTAETLARYINNRFMLYGRRIRVIFPHYGGDTAGSTAELDRAAAAAYAAAHPFGAAGFFEAQHTSGFVDQLTRHHVVTAMETAGDVSTPFLLARSPYAWTYGQAIDQIEDNLAEMICRSLPANGQATYGGTTLGMRRKFAILVAEHQPELRRLKNGLAACGADGTVFTVPTDRDITQTNKLPQQTQLMLQLKSDGYTSLIYFGLGGFAPMRAADNASYQPEWIASGFGELGNYPDIAWESMPPSQTRHLIGLGTANKPLRPIDDPGLSICQNQACDSRPSVVLGYYRPLLLLAAGIQAAGPRLTPESFAAGLRALAFPNPSLNGSELYGVGRVGFSDRSRSMMRDFGAFAWNQLAASRSARGSGAGQSGASCLLLQGRRWALGTWPRNLDFTKTTPCY
jgi:hypothetical protein